MSFRDFATGFMQGFDKTGGTQKLSSFTARNIADGQHYNPYNDPVFIRELENARKLNTPSARQNVVEEYGQFVDMGDASPEDYFFSPAEGTNEHFQNQLAEIQLENAKVENEYLPEQMRINTELAQNDLTKSNIYNRNYENILSNQMEGQDLSNQAAQFNLEQNKTLAPFEVEQAKQSLDMGDVNLNAAQWNLQKDKEMWPTQRDMQDEQLYQLQATNDVLSDRLQNELSIQEQQIVNNQLQQELNQLSLEKGRELFPFEVEQVEQNIIGARLQNEGMELQNTGRDLNNQMAEMQLEQAQNPQAQEDVSLTAMMESLGFDMGDYRGRAEDGNFVFQSDEGGRISVNPTTGQWQDFTGQDVQGESLGGNIIYRLPSGEILRQNQAGLAVYDDGTPYVDEDGYMHTFTNTEGYIRTERMDPDFGINNNQNVSDTNNNTEDDTGFWESIAGFFSGNNNNQVNNTPIEQNQNNATTRPEYTGPYADRVNRYREAYGVETTAPKYPIDRVAMMYYNQYGEDAAELLSNQPAETKMNIEKQYGIRVDDIINYLREQGE